MFAFSVHVCGCRVNMSVCLAYMRVFCKESQERILYEDSFKDKRCSGRGRGGGGVISRYTAKMGEMHSL